MRHGRPRPAAGTHLRRDRGGRASDVRPREGDGKCRWYGEEVEGGRWKRGAGRDRGPEPPPATRAAPRGRQASPSAQPERSAAARAASNRARGTAGEQAGPDRGPERAPSERPAIGKRRGRHNRRGPSLGPRRQERTAPRAPPFRRAGSLCRSIWPIVRSQQLVRLAVELGPRAELLHLIASSNGDQATPRRNAGGRGSAAPVGLRVRPRAAVGPRQ